MNPLHPHPRTWLTFTSIALNIFLVAFVFGRMSIMPDKAHHERPPFAQEGELCEHGVDSHRPPFHGDPMHDRTMPPPPPLFSPEMIFSKEEMEKDFPAVKSKFDAMQVKREEFLKTLEHKQLSKEEILAHFAEIDAIMDGVRVHAQQKAAEKLSSMSEEERKEFITRAQEHGHRPPPPPHSPEE
jgi:hypothetical protein